MSLFCVIGIKQQLFHELQLQPPPLAGIRPSVNNGTISLTAKSNINQTVAPVKVFSPPSNSTSNVASCLILKNETLYLNEWLDFHIALGFSPIYIYDNSQDFELNNTPYSGTYSWYESREDIQSHIRLIHFPQAPAQVLAYDQCLKKDAIESTFVALIDVDEFLVLKTFDNVVTFMDYHCNITCGQLSINWQMMGTSGEKQYTSVPVTKRNVHSNGKTSGTIKVIVRPRYVHEEMHWRHSVMLKWGFWLDTDGTILGKKNSHKQYDWKRQANPNKPHDVALLYHYAFKSEREFYHKTCVRGHSRPVGQNQISKCGTSSNYYQLENGTVFDDLAWRQLTRMVPKYRMHDKK